MFPEDIPIAISLEIMKIMQLSFLYQPQTYLYFYIFGKKCYILTSCKYFFLENLKNISSSNENKKLI